ncbi:MAG: DMT family transporter [Phoenicibacter congonensis]|uniref:DMT family transporter n=1 Tax=Phoenicibacter congonensis TaxID=1944646 RepID=A0AA43RIR9_9ACTN|nr:DMT family transporter [Phoenicibacter congonensis]
MKSSFWNQRSADLVLAFVGACWGLSYITMKFVMAEMTPFWMASFRFLFAFSLVALVFFKKLKETNVEIMKAAAIVGAFDALIFLTLLQGLGDTSVTNAGFLCSTSVVIVPIIHAIIVKKLPSKRVVFCCLIAIVGIGFMSLKGSLTFSPEDLWCLACAFAYAGWVLTTCHFAKKLDSLLVGIWQLFFTFVYLTIYSLFTESFSLPTSSIGWVNLLIMAFLCTGFGFVMQTVAQRYTSPEHASLMFCLEPVSASILGFFILGEVVELRAYFGAFLILLAVVLSNLRKPGESTTVEPAEKHEIAQDTAAHAAIK